MYPTQGHARGEAPTSTAGQFSAIHTSTNKVLDDLLKGRSPHDPARSDRDADLTNVHAQSATRKSGKPSSETLQALGQEYRSVTATRGGRRINGATAQPPTQALPPDDQSAGATRQLVDDAADGSSDSVVEVNSADSDDESMDEAFGTDDNPKMSAKSRADYEQMVFTGKENTTLKYKSAWEDAKKLEDEAVRSKRLKKYGFDMVAGAANQATSFGVAGITAALAGNPWLFPVVAMLTSDLVGDRLAQVIRDSTMVAQGTRNHFENHRRLARSLGDLLESCAGHAPHRKFSVEITDPATQKKTKEKMTACGALRHAGCLGGLSAWGQNLLVRGLPFVWFSAIYGPRDFYMNALCPNSFYVPSSVSAWPNSTAPTACPDPDEINPVALRWSMVLLSGMMAGALTAVSNQLLTSLLPHEEKTNYSRDTWAREVRYKESAITDCKNFLDYLGTPAKGDTEAATVIEGVETLKCILEKELRVARKKSSLWTSFQGELDLATQKHRDETMITPEFGGKRLELFMSMLGKFLTLLCFAYMTSRFVVRTSEDEQEKIMGLIFIPLSLIVLGGYAFRDDARLVGQLPYGAVKGAFRACKKQADAASPTPDVQPSTTSTEVPRGMINDATESGQSSSTSSASTGRGRSEKIHSASSTPARHNVQPDGTPGHPQEEESSEIV